MNNFGSLQEPIITGNKLVSIIIVNFNGEKWLGGCLTSVFKQNYQAIEVIVVDNGSNDGSCALIANNFPLVKLIKNEINLGFVEGNNIGYQVSSGQYILLLNNDTIVTDDFLEKLVEYLEQNSDVGVVQPKIYVNNFPRLLDSVGSMWTYSGFLSANGFWEKDLGQYDKIKPVFSVKGACVLIRRQLIDKIGLFPPEYFAYFEETDFCWRVWLNGSKVLFYPGVCIYHDVGRTSNKLPSPFIDYHCFKNRINSIIKNLSGRLLLVVLPFHILICLFVSFLFACSLKFNNSFAIIKAILWNFFQLRNIFKQRSLIQSIIRKKTDQEIFSLVQEPINYSKMFRILKIYLRRW